MVEILREYATLLLDKNEYASQPFLAPYDAPLRVLFGTLWCLQTGQIGKEWMRSALVETADRLQQHHSETEFGHLFSESSLLSRSLLSLSDYLKMLGDWNMARSALVVSCRVLQLEQVRQPLLCTCLLNLADLQYRKCLVNDGERTLADAKLLL